MESLAQMHWLDGTILAMLALGALLGARSGVARMVLRLIAYVAAVYGAIYLSAPLTQFLRTHLTEVRHEIPQLFSFVGTFLAVYVTIWATPIVLKNLLQSLKVLPTNKRIDEAVELVGLKPLDRLIGAGVGAIFVALVMGTLLFGSAQSNDSAVHADLDGSKLRPILVSTVEKVLVAIPQEDKDALVAALKRLEQEMIKLAAGLGLEAADNAIRKVESASKPLGAG